MTTRDPRSRAPLRPETGREGAREPTQSLQLDISGAPPDDERDSHPSIALGTSDAGRQDRTKIESPSGRNKTPQPKAPTKPPPTPSRGPDDPENRLGQVLGAYKLLDTLGKGGMGYVFRAEHVKLGREVALKLLRGDYAKRRDAVLRFFQEAKTVNRVRHRNIVDVTDFVELDDGTTFIIMEFLRGQSLGKWARTGIDLPRALAVLVQICDGLGAAHAVGVVHRDLKPDNVIVVPTSDGAEMVKLLDFGVAKLLNRDDEDVGFQTAAGSVIGTPAYMSPEQAGGMVVDHRSDIYSLGAIMYELFCGQPMFRGRSFGEYVRKHLTEAPVLPHMTTGGANIDPHLEGLILKCLAKE
ncbi:MAG TPA: serine/threonine-protein kinase, partial [Kofleriaceae bacterium]